MIVRRLRDWLTTPASSIDKQKRLCFEQMEPRLVMSAASITSLAATVGEGRMVTLSGLVADENPATVAVSFSGVMTGTATPNAQGWFEYSGEATGLGAVNAVALDAENLLSAVEQAQVTSAPPTVTVNVQELGSNRQVRVTGHLTDEAAAGRTVTLSGKVSGSAITDQNGDFSIDLQATGLGNVLADAEDVWGLAANTAQGLLQSATPTITGFTVAQVIDTFWDIYGSVDDEAFIGLTVHFGGVLAGHSAVVDENGNFGIAVELSAEDDGLVTAMVLDQWGLQSPFAQDLISQA